MTKLIKIGIFTLAFVALIAVLNGCSEIAQLTSIGSDAHVTCYSGDKLIGEWQSNGKVATEHGSDGWYFKDKKTGNLIRVSGACVIEN